MKENHKKVEHKTYDLLHVQRGVNGWSEEKSDGRGWFQEFWVWRPQKF